MNKQAASVAAKPGSISVALATYNGANYIAQQLSSIASQTKLPDELVVSDDISNDETIALIRRFSKTAPFPVNILQNERSLGFRGNFIRCANNCKSELIAFCDQDDIWAPSKLAIQKDDFNDPEIMLSCHNAELVDPNGALIGRRLDQFHRTCRLDFVTAGPFTFPRGFTQMARKSLLQWEWLRLMSLDIGDIGQVMSHDGWVFFVALLHGFAIYHQEPLAFYRQHNENASGSVMSKQARFRARFAWRPSEFDRLAKVWANRSEMLRRLQKSRSILDGAVETRVCQAIERYDRAALAAERRNTFYATPHRLTRTKLLVQAMARREFRRRDPWAFPIEGAIKDVASIFLNP